MPIPSPLHERTRALCTSYRWKDWSGYAAVCSYDTTHDREYFAFRESAGLLDVSPLHKYEVSGPDAAALLAEDLLGGEGLAAQRALAVRGAFAHRRLLRVSMGRREPRRRRAMLC